jgi:hypothetical protein
MVDEHAHRPLQTLKKAGREQVTLPADCSRLTIEPNNPSRKSTSGQVGGARNLAANYEAGAYEEDRHWKAQRGQDAGQRLA